jgi:hypothetical protein
MEPNYALELYKLEYERCAMRYEDIYKAIWTNFSYLSVVAGAVLTFGSTHLNTDLAAFIACFPLLFWYWATYLPLDRYGDNALNRLKQIEQTLNKRCTIELDHYTGFLQTKTPDTSSPSEHSPFKIRARYAIKAFFFFLHLIAILLSHKLYGLHISLILGVITFSLYIGTHLEPPGRSLKSGSKALLLLAVGGAILLLLITTPMPKRKKEMKKMIVTNKEGIISVNSEGEEDETFVIQLVGFDDVVLK